MWWDDSFSQPFSPFRVPIPLPTVDPDGEDLVQICVNRAYLPYIAGALKALILQTTWQTDDPTALNITQGRIFNLIGLFADPPDCVPTPVPPVPPVHFVDIEDDMPQFRQVDCKLQVQCADGTWDTIFDPTDCINSSIQDRTGQPPDGGKPDFGVVTTVDAQNHDSSRFLYPYAVNPGDTVAITNAHGAMSPAPGIAAWYCPSGRRFLLGECQGVDIPAGGGYPITTANVMRLIAVYDGVYYDAFNTTFTIPTTATPSDLYFLENDTDITDNQGSYSYTVTVTRPAAPTIGGFDWTQVYDFTIHEFAGQWLNYDPGSGSFSYVSGQGRKVTDGNQFIVETFLRTPVGFVSCDIRQITLTWRYTRLLPGSTFSGTLVADSFSSHGAFGQSIPAQHAIETTTQIFNSASGNGVFNAGDSDHIFVQMVPQNIPSTGNIIYLEKITISGTGDIPTFSSS